jgi:hypothetical protein
MLIVRMGAEESCRGRAMQPTQRQQIRTISPRVSTLIEPLRSLPKMVSVQRHPQGSLLKRRPLPPFSSAEPKVDKPSLFAT